MADRDAIVDFLDDYLDIDGYPDRLPVGLQVPGAGGVRPGRIRRVGVARAVRPGRRAGRADAARPPRPVLEAATRGGSVPRQKARLQALFDHDLSLVAYHLALDAHPEVGNNALICDALELRSTACASAASG